MSSSLPQRRIGRSRRDGAADDQFTGVSADDVGAFERGNRFSRWALARYIVGRVILERVGWTMLLAAVVVLAIAAVFEWVAHLTGLAVLFLVLALIVLAARAALRGILRKLTGAALYGPLADQADRIVKDSRAGVFAELRRVGLPSHLVTMPLIGVRLLSRRRRADTTARIRSFDVERAVPRSRRDELHLLLEQAAGRRSAV